MTGNTDERDPLIGPGGSGAGHVEALRKVYERCAEATERAINALDASAVQAGQDLRAVAGGAREAAHRLSESGMLAARGTRDQVLGLSEHSYALLEEQAVRNRDGLRSVAQQMLIAFDTNVRAGLDCAERLAEAQDAKSFLTIQLAFLHEQSRRSAQQIVDFQQLAAQLVRSSASAHSD